MSTAGFYGKLPSEGDFVSRRLPWEFTSAWDAWLQQGLHASRAALGPRWLELYLSAPVWRFQLAPGVCGPQGWRGLFFASVDRVGRYFPLTLAFAHPPADGAAAAGLATLEADDEAWLAIEDVALTALDPAQSLDVFDRAVLALSAPAAGTGTQPASAVCLFTHGAPAVPATALELSSLPSATEFAALIAGAPAPGAPSPAESPDSSRDIP
jgi:type VI secretion system protein ImpM